MAPGSGRELSCVKYGGWLGQILCTGIPVPSNTRVWLAVSAADMQHGFGTLASKSSSVLAEDHMMGYPICGFAPQAARKAPSFSLRQILEGSTRPIRNHQYSWKIPTDLCHKRHGSHYRLDRSILVNIRLFPRSHCSSHQVYERMSDSPRFHPFSACKFMRVCGGITA